MDHMALAQADLISTIRTAATRPRQSTVAIDGPRFSEVMNGQQANEPAQETASANDGSALDKLMAILRGEVSDMTPREALADYVAQVRQTQQEIEDAQVGHPGVGIDPQDAILTKLKEAKAEIEVKAATETGVLPQSPQDLLALLNNQISQMENRYSMTQGRSWYRG